MGKGGGRQPTGAVGRDERVHHGEILGVIIGDQDLVDPGVERRDAGCGDAGLLP
jgi:hypothetical protein